MALCATSGTLGSPGHYMPEDDEAKIKGESLNNKKTRKAVLLILFLISTQATTNNANNPE